MKSLNEDIKNGQYKQIYLLYGEETYLKKQYKEKLGDGIVSKTDTMNRSYFEGKGISIPQVIDLSETLPFFSEKRLIIIEDSGFFKGKSDDLADYMKSIPETSYFIFIEAEVDRRSRLFKAVKEKGRVVELNHQEEQTLMRWVMGLLNKDHKKITQKNMQLLLSKTGSNMENIQREVEKLLCYTIDKEVIEASDIEEICVGQVTNKIFDMIRAISQKQQKLALQLYYDLLSLKEPPMRILFLIARQFHLLLQVKELIRLGFDQAAIGKKVGLQSFIVKNYVAQGRSFSTAQLEEAVKDCVITEEAVKTGKLQDVISVELLIVKYSGA